MQAEMAEADSYSICKLDALLQVKKINQVYVFVMQINKAVFEI